MADSNYSISELGYIDNNLITATDDLFVGSLYIALSVGFAVPYIRILKLFAEEDEFKSQPAYRIIMYHFGVLDLMQLALHFTSGIWTLAGETAADGVAKMVGAIGNAASLASVLMMVLLAFNRLVEMILPHKVDDWFSHNATTGWLVIVWLYYMVIFSVYSSPYLSIRYWPDDYAWTYVGPWGDTGYAYTCEWITTFTLIGVCTIFYIIIIVDIKKKSALMSASQVNYEVRLAIQVFCLVVYTPMMFFTWNFVAPLLDPNKWNYLWINMLWVGWNGLNPLVYLVFNTSLRAKFFNAAPGPSLHGSTALFLTTASANPGGPGPFASNRVALVRGGDKAE